MTSTSRRALVIRLWKAVSQAVFDRPLEMLVAVEAFSIGVFLFLPFSSFTSSPTLSVMGRWLPEPVWAHLFLWVGMAQFVALASERHRFIRLTATIAAVLWLIVSVSFLYGNPYSTALVTYPMFVLANLVIIARYAK